MLHVWIGTELKILSRPVLRVANAQPSGVLLDLAWKLHFIRKRFDKIPRSRCRLLP